MLGFLILFIVAVASGAVAGLVFLGSLERETVVLAEQFLMMTLAIVSAVCLAGALICGYLGDLIGAVRASKRGVKP